MCSGMHESVLWKGASKRVCTSVANSLKPGFHLSPWISGCSSLYEKLKIAWAEMSVGANDFTGGLTGGLTGLVCLNNLEQV